MAINWSEGLHELGSGLLRQADIGGRAYEGAMAAEAETRAADRALAAEERAAKRDYDKEIRQAEIRESEFQRSLEHDLTLQELGHGFSIDELIKRAELQEAADIKQFGRQSAHEIKVWKMNRYAEVRDKRDAAKTAAEKLKIEVNLKQAESLDKKVTETLKLWLKAIEEGDTQQTEALELELSNAELQSREAWRKAGADPLTTKKISEVKEFEIIGGEIVQAINLETGEKVFRQAITAIKQGKGSSGYDAAYETVSRTIDRIIEERSAFKNYRGPKKRRLKKQIIESLLPNVNLGEATPTDVVDEGNGSLGSSFLGGDPIDDIAVDITAKDVGSYTRAKAAFDARGQRGGRLQSPELKELNRAKKRDPAYLLPLLKQEKAKIEDIDSRTPGGAHWLQDKLGRINELISKFEAMVGADQAALPQGLNINQGGAGRGGFVDVGGGMVNPRGGMIFEADRMNMDPAAVNARYA